MSPLHQSRGRSDKARDVGSSPQRAKARKKAIPATTECRDNWLTRVEMNDAIVANQVVIFRTGPTEQHGRHLPVDVDLFRVASVGIEVGKRAADRVLVLPPIAYGLNRHHIDFPGTIQIEPETHIAFLLNITRTVPIPASIGS